MQEVSIAALGSAESFTPGTNFTAWAREIARRRVLAHVRKRNRGPAYFDPEVLEALCEAANSVESEEPIAERCEILNQCLGKLGEEPRTVLRLKYWDRLNAEESAREVGRSVQAIYGILKRTRILLRDCAAKHSDS